MRILAVDPGNVRIGLALSDPTGTLAKPLHILQHTSREEDALRIAELSAQNKAELILVGIALDAENRPTLQSRKSKRLAAAIRDACELEVHLWEESYSSQDAEQTLKELGKSSKDRHLDDLAAARILQSYLDAHQEAPTDAE